MHIEHHAQPCEEAAKLAEAQQIEYERQHQVLCAYAPFQFTAQEDGRLVGVLAGYTAYKEIYVDDIVVFKGYRGRGIGRSLLEEAERFFEGRGFNNINLVTNGFQAPGFYQKCGYELEFIRENRKDAKYNKYFFVKFL